MRTRVLLFAPMFVGAFALRATLCHASPPPAAASTPAPVEPVDEQSEFEKARNAYRAQKYDEADTRFLHMLDPQHGTLHDKVLIKQARMYWAATLLAEHHDEDATLLFETLLTEDRDYEPDPLAFPTEVVNAFIDTRARLRERLEAIEREQYRHAAERRVREEATRQQRAARLKLLEKLAAQAEVTEKHSRWVALLPFGVGQFQNGQRGLGWFFLGTEAALVAGGIATLPIYYVDLANVQSTYTPENAPVAQQYLDRANDARYVNLALYGTLALTAVVGAIQAEVAFVPVEVTIKPRIVPDVPTPPAPITPPATTSSLPLSFGAAPLAGPDGHGIRGASVGLSVSFF